MPTASIHTTFNPGPVGKSDLYLSVSGPGLGAVVRDIRHGAFTLSLTADGQMRSIRVVDMQDQGGVFAEVARYYMTTRKNLSKDLQHRLVSACAEEGRKILSLRAARDAKLLSQAKLKFKFKACQACAPLTSAHKANLQTL